jgi:2-polyprenyl-6-hydroxyphenyl methylase/3-demethylubiquinone-9 3-methyltransferase
LTKNEREEISKLLDNKKEGLSDLEQTWHFMDLVWDNYDCNSHDMDSEKFKKFYSHPVWLLNGLFIEQHDLSMSHRHAISDWIINKAFTSVVDYGGGFGTLARLIAEKDRNINVYILEPYPSDFGLKRVKEFQNINFIKELEKKYDCLVATDTLEHVFDPLDTFSDMVKSVNKNGYLVIANCFEPVIKCHLPQHFHFRHSFNTFAGMMGLKVVSKLDNSHATIFKKMSEPSFNWKKIRFYEKVSKILFPIIEIIKCVFRPIKKLLTK